MRWFRKRDITFTIKQTTFLLISYLPKLLLNFLKTTHSTFKPLIIFLTPISFINLFLHLINIHTLQLLDIINPDPMHPALITEHSIQKSNLSIICLIKCNKLCNPLNKIMQAYLNLHVLNLIQQTLPLRVNFPRIWPFISFSRLRISLPLQVDMLWNPSYWDFC